MNIFMRGDHAVPMIIAKHTVKQEPKIVKTRKFVGLRAGFAAIAERAIDTLLDCFWVTESEVTDKGDSEVVHYAVDISDDPGANGPELVVTKLDGRSRPGCGIYCEVISVSGLRESHAQEPAPPVSADSKAKLVSPRVRRPGTPHSPPSDERIQD